MGPPSPPDANATAKAQSQYDIQTATAQQELNQTNQNTPYGSLSYKQTGTRPDGTPIFSADTTLAPAQQALLDKQTGTQSQAANIARALLTNSGGTLSAMPDFSANGIEGRTMELGNKYLQPIFDQQNSAQEAKLMNQGIAPGTEAWTNAFRDTSRNQNDAYTNLLLKGQGDAINATTQQYQLPLSAYSQLMGGAAPNGGQFAQTPTTSVQPVDYTGMVNNQYQAQSKQYGDMMNGLFSIPSTILGGWATGGMKLPSFGR